MSETIHVNGEVAENRGEQEVAGSSPLCIACAEPAAHFCLRCASPICLVHGYHDEGSELYFCRACADDAVGVCAICDALYARPCDECGQKMCEQHRVQIVRRWGWGGLPGQAGVTDWFPMRATYCEQHAQGRSDAPRPKERTFKAYDASSPEY